MLCGEGNTDCLAQYVSHMVLNMVYSWAPYSCLALRRCFSIRELNCKGNGARGLSVCVYSIVDGFKSYELPRHAAGEEVTHISMGVRCLAAFSQHNPSVWLHPLNCKTTLTTCWRKLCLPSESITGRCGGIKIGNGGGGDGIAMVANGLSHCMVLANSGKVYGSGLNYFGQSGSEPSLGGLVQTEEQESYVGGVLTEVGPGRIKQVVCGLDHTLLLLETGTVWACGWAADGQTGVGSYENTGQLKPVDLGGRKVRSLSSFADSSFALTKSDEVFAWGNNEYRQLGVASAEPQVAIPHSVDVSFMDGAVTAISAGGPFTAFLTVQGSVYVCGYNVEGQVQASEHCPSPASMHQMRQLHDGQAKGMVSSVSAGLNYLLALGINSGKTGLVWGKLELPHLSRHWHYCSKFKLRDVVLDVACGPLELAMLTNTQSSQPELISLQATTS